MLDYEILKNNINSEDYFLLALSYYKKLMENNYELNEEMPQGIGIEDIVVINKSISIMLVHPTIQTPSIEVCLDLFTKNSPIPLGKYQLITDNEQQFIDEYLILK